MKKHTTRTRALAIGAGLVIALAAGTAAAVTADDDDNRNGPIPVEPDGGIGATPDDEFPVDQSIEDARALLGLPEADLPDDVRIGRSGDEHFALTADYVLGRMTVELDDAGDGLRVTSVTVELPDGPQTVKSDAG